ncbi:T-lymphocyte activation antigen CD86 [Pseudophryne corroboree]|uniref:T-lymphocyte activation antigen CD86 n=1 Tax=Pseudophryne corroboree TaxID=495146 RepID=UPI00308160F9
MRNLIMVLLLLLLVPVLHCAEASQENKRGTAFVSGAAELKCNFNNSKNISWKDLTLYWQIGTVKMVNTIRFGKEERKWNSKNYTMVFQPNGDLTLYNITLQDMAIYTCLVISDSDKVHESTFQLDVIANFTKPEIENSSISTTITLNQGDTVDLRCSSGNGFPEPQKMFWKVSDENRTTPYYPEHKIINISSAFNISSSLSWKVEHSINITCVLVAHGGESSSTALEIEVRKKPRETGHNYAIISSAIATIIILTMAGIILFICLKNKHGICNRDVPHREEEMRTLRSDGNNQPVPTQITTANETANGSS